MPTPIRLVGGDVTRVVGVVTCRWEGGMEGRGHKRREREIENRCGTSGRYQLATVRCVMRD